MTADFMNSTAIIGKRDLSESQVACIDVLKEMLADALAGKVYGIACAVAIDEGYGTIMGGGRIADLNLACDEMKRKLLDAANQKQKPKAKPSNILRARMT